jgi:hypothetical protein
MPLSLREISRLSRALVAAHYAARVEVAGVTHTESESEFAEVLLTVRPHGAADRRGPRTVLVQVRRVDAATLEGDLRKRLTLPLRTRPAPG